MPFPAPRLEGGQGLGSLAREVHRGFCASRPEKTRRHRGRDNGAGAGESALLGGGLVSCLVQAAMRLPDSRDSSVVRAVAAHMCGAQHGGASWRRGAGMSGTV